jgi:PAS domain S-box-containing protein
MPTDEGALVRWREVVERIGDPALLLDAAGSIQAANACAVRLLDLSAPTEPGQRMVWPQVHSEGKGAAVPPGLAQLIASQGAGGGALRCRLTRPGREALYAELSVSWVERGPKALALVLVRDLGWYAAERQAWTEERQRFVEAQRIGNMGNWMLDLKRQCFHISPHVYAMYELDPALSPVPQDEFFRRLHPQDVEHVKADFARALKENAAYEHVFRLRLPDGREKTMRARGEVSGLEDGPRVVGVVQDISALAEAQRDRDRVASVLDATANVVFMASRSGAVFYSNRAARVVLGDRDGTSIASLATCLCSPEATRRLMDEAMPLTLRDGRWSGEVAVLDGQGKAIPMSLNVLAHLDFNGDTQYLSLIFHDISEQRAAQVLLERQRQQLDEAQTLARMGSWVVDLPERRVTWSRALYGVLGYESGAAEPSIEAFVAVLHPDDRERVLQEMAKDFSQPDGDFNTLSFRIVTRAGVRHMQQRIGIARDPSGQVFRLFGTTADVTEITEAKEQLRTSNIELERRVAERTAQLSAINQELDTFAYSVSHDLKAPLRTIEGFSQCLEEDCSDQLDEAGRQHLVRIRRGVLQMGELINGLLSYARMERRAMQTERIDLTTTVRQLLDLFQADIVAGNTEIRLALEETQLRTDREGTQVVLRNLIGNALKFGRQAERSIVEVGSRREGLGVRLWVRDNGPGFDMRYHDRIFGLFQRLSGSEQVTGTGVGLALVAKAMQRMGGRVWAQSEPGQGSTFHVFFPD